MREDFLLGRRKLERFALFCKSVIQVRHQEQSNVTHLPKPRVSIEYCTQCNWMLRAAWMAQELLQTFGQDIGEVALIPGTGGIFIVQSDGAVIWDRKADGGFPEAKILKQRLRDHAWPERRLGHSDR
jgi:selenoprotein W-related protein